MKTPVYKDRVKIYVESGNGGDGNSTFRREAHVPRGGPSGGDGGNGADVYMVAKLQCDSLLDLYFRPHHRAEHGAKGGNKDCHGRNGKDLYITVPCGTVVVNAETEQPVCEIVEPDQPVLIAKGGVGGLGNKRFMTPSDQAPSHCTPGTLGEKYIFWLTLKTIADVGFVGYPNAGKSTLLNRLTGANPKVAPYPFTTLNPIIGTLQLPRYKRLRVADIPGLIDGAHEGVGLGHDFLRHIERTRFLVFVIDMGGVDARNPTEDFQNLKEELRLYSAALDDRPFTVVANKMDVPESTEFLKEFKKETGIEPIEMSAEIGEGLDGLVSLLNDHFYPETIKLEDAGFSDKALALLRTFEFKRVSGALKLTETDLEEAGGKPAVINSIATRLEELGLCLKPPVPPEQLEAEAAAEAAAKEAEALIAKEAEENPDYDPEADELTS